MDAVVAQRGQVTIPKDLRDKLGIVPGTVLEFHAENGRLVATKRVGEHPAFALLGKRAQLGFADQKTVHRRGCGAAELSVTTTTSQKYVLPISRGTGWWTARSIRISLST